MAVNPGAFAAYYMDLLQVRRKVVSVEALVLVEGLLAEEAVIQHSGVYEMAAGKSCTREVRRHQMKEVVLR